MNQAIQVPAPIAGGPAAASGPAGSIDHLRDVAQEFEAVFLAQVLAQLNPGQGGDEQTPFHDMFNDELAKLISRSGGVGVADAVLKEMLKSQEVA
jgi:Rod binding domain-containing protein